MNVECASLWLVCMSPCSGMPVLIFCWSLLLLKPGSLLICSGNVPANLENSAVATGQFSFQSQRKAMTKNVQTTTQLHSSHTLAKQCSKFSMLGFNSTWTKNFDVQAGFRKDRETRVQIANIHWIIEKAREFQKKKSASALLIMLKSLTVGIKINCGKFWKRWKYQTTLTASCETCMQVKKG